MNAGNSSHTNYTKAHPTHLRLWMLIILLLCAPSLLAADISARVDRARLSIDETLQLMVRVSPQTDSGPDFSQLEAQFDILGRTQNSQYRNINGQVEAFTEWQLTLAPKATGKLIIPSFEYQGSFSDAILLNVTDAAAFDQDAAPDLFLEVTVDKEQAFVQEQILVNVKLHTAIPLRIQDASALTVDHSLVVNLGDTQYQKRVGEKVYTIKELRYALFPQKSGTLEIPVQTFTVITGSNRSWSNPFQIDTGGTRRVRSRAISLDIQPAPDQFAGKDWLPAQQLSLTEEGLEHTGEWMVGEPLTRKIHIAARGLTENQIPALSLQAPKGLKFYSEPADRNDQVHADGVSTLITETHAIVPTQAGEYTLPGITLHWWNTDTQTTEIAQLPARTVTVAPNPDLPATPDTTPDLTQAAAIQPAAPAPQSPAASTPNNHWYWVSLALFISNLLTLSLWYFLHHRQPAVDTPEPSPAPAPDWQHLADLCEGELTSARAIKILRWLDSWAKPFGKQPLTDRLTDANLHTLAKDVAALEAYAYSPDTTFTGALDRILAQVKATRPSGPATAPKRAAALRPLYPN